MLLLLIVLKWRPQEQQADPSSATLPARQLDENDEGRSTLDLAIADLRARVEALEARQGERQPLSTQVDELTKEDFERHYGPFVRSIVEEVRREEAENALEHDVREYVRGRVALYTQQFDLGTREAEELFTLLLRIKHDALEIESRFAHDNVKPHHASPEYQQWIQAWQRIIVTWSPAIGAIHGFSDKIKREIILDMATPHLTPYLP